MSSPKPKRPAAKQRDSFFRRLHKRHDDRHHPGEDRHGHGDQEQPLLRDEHPDSASEAETHSVIQTPIYQDEPQNKLTRASRYASSLISTFFKTTAGVASSMGSVVQDKVGKTRRAITHNPKRSLGTVCGALLILVVGETIDISMHHPLPSVSKELCLTPACVQAASGILSNLHPSHLHMEPCDDFEQYVCGGFRLTHELRESQGSVFTGSLVKDEVHATLRHILERHESEVKDEDKQIFKKVQDAYSACMDEDRIRRDGMNPLKSVVNELRKHFAFDKTTLRRPSPDQVISNPGSLTPSPYTSPIVYLAKLGIGALVSLEVQPDNDNANNQVVFVAPVRKLGLPSISDYQDKDIVAKYTQSVEDSIGRIYDLPTNSSANLNRRIPRHTLKDLARGIVQLESKLASITPSQMDLMDVLKHSKLTFIEIDNVLPQISFPTIIRELAPFSYEGESLIIRSLSYLKSLSTILTATPDDFLQAFLVWKVVQAFAHAVEDESLSQWKQLLKSVSGKSPAADDDRWYVCTSDVNRDFGWILSKFFVERKFSEDFKKAASQVLADVIGAYRKIVSTSSWMAQEDRAKAIIKLERLKSRVGYPDSGPDIHDPTALRDFYAQVYVQNNTYFENNIQSARASVQRQWLKLDHSRSNSQWPIFPTDVDAYYNVQSNEMVLPAAIIRDPMLYGPDLPLGLSYGAFGALVGHELIHAFDNIGSRYNANGTFAHWWSNTTSIAFEERAECFAEQYSRYTVPGSNGEIRIDGNLTLKESISDAGGVHSAYQAWAQKEVQNPSQSLPGLAKFTQKQLFWLSYGNWWCSKATEKSLKHRVLVDPFLPESIRIKGTVFNSREFREAFNCRIKEPGCELW